MEIEYLNLHTTDPYFNLACEQYVFDELPKNKSYIMLWQNDNAIIVGKYQNTYAEINTEYVKEHGIKVVRRLSGGGTGYHDLGNLNYTFITDAGEMDQLNLKLFCLPVVNVLRKIGIKAELDGRNDITIGGRKFSGNSQYAKKGRVMHHGTILYNSDLSVVEKALFVDQSKIVSKGIKSVRSRVTNVSDHLENNGISLPEFRDILLQEMIAGGNASEHILTLEEIEKIRELRVKYVSWEWNYGQSSECTITRSQRFADCGKVEMYITVQGGIVSDLEFRGDFFSYNEPSVLARKLVGGKSISVEAVEAMSQNELQQYFAGIHKEEFIAFLKNALLFE